MKKVFRIISLIFIFFSLFFITKVQAATDDIKIDSISIKETFGSIYVEEPKLDNNNLTSNIIFNEEDDYVVFKVTLKNVSEEKYKIISIADNNKNENISIEYEYNENYIESGKTKNVSIKLKYKNQLMDIEKITLDDLTVRFNLEKENGKQSEIIINPFTHDALLRYLGLLVLTLIGLLVLVITKNKKKIGVGTLVVLFAATLIPFAAIANEKYTVDLKYTNIDIMGKVEVPKTTAILVDGESFRAKLNNDLTTFREATEEEYDAIKDTLTDDNIVSIEDSPEIAYLWFNGESALYYSKADIIYMNEDSSHMFEDTKFINIDLSGLDSSITTNMSSMFKECKELLAVDITSFNTKNVTNMSYMFYECNELEQLDLLKFDTEIVTDMSYMFTDCYSLIVLDLSSFDTRNLENADYMFVGSGSLQTIYVSNGWVDRSIRVGEVYSDPEEYPDCLNSPSCEGNEIADTMFSGCYNLVGEMGTSYDDRGSFYYDSAYARVDRGPYKRGFLTLKGTMDIAIFIEGPDFNNKLLALNTEGKSFRHATEEEYNAIKDNLTEDNIVSLSKMTPIYMWETNNNVLYYSEAEYIYFNPDSSYMFANSSLVNVDVSEIGGFLAEDMSYMFYQNEYLTNVNFGENTGGSNNSGSAMISNNKVSADVLSTVNDNKLLLLIPILIIVIGIGIYAILRITKINKNSITIGLVIIVFIIASLAIVFATFGSKKLLAYVGPENGKIDSTPGHFSTEKVENFDSMFEGCSSLVELDLSVFEVNGTGWTESGDDSYDSFAVSIGSMFNNCTKLETIYVSTMWKNYVGYGSGYNSAFSGDDVFVNCYELVGEKGTAYLDGQFDQYNSDAVYARVDEGTYEGSGYFTLKGHTKNLPKEAVLMEGGDFSHRYLSYGDSIFRRATNEEFIEKKDELTEWDIVSIPDSTNIYMWRNNTGENLFFSKAETIYFNEDSSEFFSQLNSDYIEISDLDTSRVTDMSSMFSGCTAFEINLSSFDTSNVTDMSSMFSGCAYLETIYVSDLWDTSKVENSDNMFSYTNMLMGEKGTSYDENNVDVSYAHIDGGQSNPGYLTTVNHTSTISKLLYGEDFRYILNRVGNEGKYFRHATEEEYNAIKNSLTMDNIVSINKTRSAATFLWKSGDDILYYSEAGNILMNADSSSMFAYTSLVTIDLSGFDASQVTNMSNMFYDSNQLTSVDLSMLDTRNVTDMSYMFYECNSLTSVNFGEYSSNISGSAKNINNNRLSADVLSITDASKTNHLIILIPILFVIIGIGIYTVLKTKKFKKTEMTVGMLALTIVIGSIAIFIGSISLNKLLSSVNQNNEQSNQTSLFNTSKVTDMEFMFGYCHSLTELDLSLFDVSSLEDMSYMFYASENLETIYVSDKWSLDIIIDDDACYGTDYYVSGLNGKFAFSGCTSLIGGKGTTYNKNHVSEGYARVDGGITAPGYFTMIGHGKELPSYAVLLDGESFNSKIQQILGTVIGSDLYVEYGYSFRPATEEEYNNAKNSLTNDNVVSTPGTQKVYVWSSGNDTVYYSNADTIYLNKNCKSMFSNMDFTKLDLSGFDSSLVSDMYNMFFENYSLEEIDLSSFDVSNVTSASSMFGYCESLTTVYVSDSWNFPREADEWYMFYGCSNLVGGAGTSYADANEQYGDYAHIDGGVDNPGYFTDIRDKQ